MLCPPLPQLDTDDGGAKVRQYIYQFNCQSSREEAQFKGDCSLESSLTSLNYNQLEHRIA